MCMSMNSTGAAEVCEWCEWIRYHFEEAKRNTFDGMVSVVDSAVANVTAALKSNGMYVRTYVPVRLEEELCCTGFYLWSFAAACLK